MRASTTVAESTNFQKAQKVISQTVRISIAVELSQGKVLSFRMQNNGWLLGIFWIVSAQTMCPSPLFFKRKDYFPFNLSKKYFNSSNKHCDYSKLRLARMLKTIFSFAGKFSHAYFKSFCTFFPSVHEFLCLCTCKNYLV